MNIKLAYYKLIGYGETACITPGTKVCSCNGARAVGVIVGMSDKKKDIYYQRKKVPETVTVLWGSGSKRGKLQQVDPENLINFDQYFRAVEKDYIELKLMFDQAATVGM